MVRVYAGLEGFPTPQMQPGYYQMLTDIGQFANRPGARVLVAIAPAGELVGGIVYFGEISQYGSGGSGAGKALAQACIALARAQGQRQIILHTTMAMQVAWAMYESRVFAARMSSTSCSRTCRCSGSDSILALPAPDLPIAGSPRTMSRP